MFINKFLVPPLSCNGAGFSECILDSNNLANFLKSKGGVNIPEPAESREVLNHKLKEWYIHSHTFGPDTFLLMG
jgi:hypothetical protein